MLEWNISNSSMSTTKLEEPGANIALKTTISAVFGWGLAGGVSDIWTSRRETKESPCGQSPAEGEGSSSGLGYEGGKKGRKMRMKTQA